MRSHESDLWRAFAVVAERHPRKAAVISVDGGRSWRAPALLADARGLSEAAGLAQARTGCIAFSLPTSPEWLETFLAIQSVGAAAMSIDPGSAVDWAATAASAGATHALIERRIVPLRSAAAAVDWTRFAYAKLTSGSTGAPNVIPCRADHLLADGTNVTRTMGIRPGDRNLAILPLGHSYGLGNLVMPLLLQGTSVVTAPSYLPRQVIEWIDAHRVTVLPAVPVVLQILADVPAKSALESLRLVISAGAPLPPATAQKFFARFGRRVHNFYGSSETGGICFDAGGGASLTGRSVGRPLCGVTVRIARGGRIAVSGPAVAVSGGRCTLADLGEWTHGDEVKILGRAGHVANIGGRKVAPAEVETALMAIPGVSAAWVTVLEIASRDFLAAAVESARAPAEIFAALEKRLPKWKCPRQIVVSSRLPRTIRGKLDVVALRKLLDQGRATGTK